MQATGDALMDIFAQIGTIRHLSPDPEEAQALIAWWVDQAYTK